MLTLEEIKNDESKNIEFKEMIPQDSKKFLNQYQLIVTVLVGKSSLVLLMEH